MPNQFLRAGAILLAWVGFLTGAPVVRVTPEYRGSRCDGVLHIEVQGVSSRDFLSSGKAWISFDKVQGPAGVLPSSNNVPVDYSLTGDTMRMDVPLPQRPSKPLEYQLTVQVQGQTSGFKDFDSPPRQRIEASVCTAPLNLTVDPPTVKDLGRGLFSVVFHVQSNRAAAVQLSLSDPHRQPALFNASIFVDPSDRLIQFTSEGSPNAVLEIREPSSPTPLYSQNLALSSSASAFPFAAMVPYFLIAVLAVAVCWLYLQKGHQKDRLGDVYHRLRMVEQKPLPALPPTGPPDHGAPSATWQKQVMDYLEDHHSRLGKIEARPVAPPAARDDDRLRVLETSVGKSLQLLSTWHFGGEQKPPKTDLTIEEQKLLAVLNCWWRSDAPKREDLLGLLDDLSISTEFYELADINHNLEVLTETKYTFRRHPKNGAWLLVKIPGTSQEYWAVPADPAGFQGNVMALVRRLYPTFDRVDEPTEFLTIYHACRVRQVEQDKYEVVPKGHGALHVKGSQRPNASPTPDYMFFRRKVSAQATSADQLPKVVKQKLEELNEILKALQRGSSSTAAPSLGPMIENLRQEVYNEIVGLKTTLRPLPQIQNTVVNLRSRLTLLEGLVGRAAQTAEPVQPQEERRLAAQPPAPPPSSVVPVAPAVVAAPSSAPRSVHPALPPPEPPAIAPPPAVEPPPASQPYNFDLARPAAKPAANELPSNWWKAFLPKLTPPAVPVWDPQDYLARIRYLQQLSIDHLSAFPESRVKLVQITSQPGGQLRLVDAQPGEDDAEAGGVHLAQTELYQLFVCVTAPGTGEAWVLLPPGGLNFDNPLNVLQALVADAGSGRVCVAALDRPAKIERVQEGLYKVVDQMRLKTAT